MAFLTSEHLEFALGHHPDMAGVYFTRRAERLSMAAWGITGGAGAVGAAQAPRQESLRKGQRPPVPGLHLSLSSNRGPRTVVLEP